MKPWFNKEEWIIKTYEEAILTETPEGIDDVIKDDIRTFVESGAATELYYVTALMIYYRKPMFWIRFSMHRRIRQKLRETSLQNATRIILNTMITYAVTKVLKGQAEINISACCMCDAEHSSSPDFAKTVKSSVKKLATFLESKQG